MIQRVQSLLLFGVALLVFLMFFFPIWSIEVPMPGSVNNKVAFFDMIFTSTNPESQLIAWQNYTLMLFSLLIIVLSFIIIFQYKNRVKQARMTQILMLLCLILTGMTLMLPETIKGDIIEMYKGINPTYGFGCILPLLTLPLTFFARKLILKDEELVRSSDRLR